MLSKGKVGQKFGRLTIVRKTEQRATAKSTNDPLYEFLCDCGSVTRKRLNTVTCGRTISCGCAKKAAAMKSMAEYDQKNGQMAFLVNKIITQYKSSAKAQGRKWDLPRALVEKITSSDCSYCGTPPSNPLKRGRKGYVEYKYSGIDRIDNNKDYEPGNVVSCCKICNRAKRDDTPSEFERWLTRIGSKWISKQYPITNVSSVPFHYARLN